MIGWWKGLSRTKRYLISMGCAFIPLWSLGLAIQFGIDISPWIMFPLFTVCMGFATLAYVIRVSS